MNISTTFQFHSPSEETIFDFFFFFFFLQISLLVATGNQSNSAVCTKFIWLVEDYSTNISEKLLSKYLQ